MRNPWRAVFLAFLVALPFLGRGLAQDAPATQTVDPESAGAREAELAEDSRGLVAGAARADITPPPGLPLWGYGSRRDTPARGTRDPLEATALVIGAGGRRMALVGLDLGRPPAREAMKAIEDRVRTEAGVESLFLVASHTHHGPCVELESVEPTASWIETASERIGGAVIEAARSLRPAKMAVLSRKVDLNRNRHSRIEPVPIDPAIRVLHLVDLEDRPIATAVSFSAHPTTVSAGVLEYSADYPGHLRRLVERKVGGVCLFLQGAVGDLSCRRDGKDDRGFGESVGEEVVSLVAEAKPVRLESPSLAYRGEELRFGVRLRIDAPLTYALYSRAFFPELVDAYVKEYEGGAVRPRLTVALLDDRIGFVGVSGELFSAHAVRLRERARLEHLFVFSCTNGYQQYFPTIEATAEGGYGADELVSPIEIGAGERIMDRALILLYELRRRRDP